MVRTGDARPAGEAHHQAMTNSTETFQLSLAMAEAYEARFVPAMFGEWAPHLCDIAAVQPGQSVLDVACGTGIVARTAAERTGAGGRVAGVDLNDAMLTVARRLRPDLEWQHGDAGDLPFASASFNAVLCQAAMMFFPDREQALREMARVAGPAGTVAVQVWGSLESSTGYACFAEVVARHAGAGAVRLFDSYWVLGDAHRLVALFESAGLEVDVVRSRVGSVRFGSIDEFVTTEAESTPLRDLIDDDVYRRIREDAAEALHPFLTPDGGVAVPIEGRLVAAHPRS